MEQAYLIDSAVFLNFSSSWLGSVAVWSQISIWPLIRYCWCGGNIKLWYFSLSISAQSTKWQVQSNNQMKLRSVWENFRFASVWPLQFGHTTETKTWCELQVCWLTEINVQMPSLEMSRFAACIRSGIYMKVENAALPQYNPHPPQDKWVKWLAVVWYPYERG